jgi:tRNA 2-thiocytidine biosynthesis protein TtcA
MKINIPQKYFSKLMRAVVEFQMIENGDKILIGLSGGKDSIFLTYAMAILKERLHKRFELEALTINPMFPDAEFHTIACVTSANPFPFLPHCRCRYSRRH